MESLFVYELDGETYPTTVQTIWSDFDEYWHSHYEIESERRISRMYGDCGMPI